MSQQGESLAIQNAHAEYKIRLDRQGGMLLASMDRHGPADGRPKVSHDGTHTPTLDELGINRSQSSRCQKIAGIPEERFAEHLARVKASLGGELTT